MYCNHIEPPTSGSLSFQSAWQCFGQADPCTIIAISTGSERMASAAFEIINIFNMIEVLVHERSFAIPKNKGKPSPCKSLCFSYCGCYLLSYHLDPNCVVIWDLITGIEAKRYKVDCEVELIHAFPILDVSVFLFVGTDSGKRVLYWFDWRSGHLQSIRNDSGHLAKSNATNKPMTPSYSNLLSTFTVLADGNGACDVYLLDYHTLAAAANKTTHLLHYKFSPPPPPSNITVKRQQQHVHWIYELQKHRTYSFTLEAATAVRMIALPSSRGDNSAKLAVNISQTKIMLLSLNSDKIPVNVLRIMELPATSAIMVALFAFPATSDRYDPIVEGYTNSNEAAAAVAVITSEVANGLSTWIMKPDENFWHKSPLPTQMKNICAAYSPPLPSSSSVASMSMNRLQLVCLEGSISAIQGTQKKWWICRRGINSSFAGAMFPVGYRLVRTSCSYEEREDEFDRVISDSSSAADAMDVVIVRQPVDCTPAAATTRKQRPTGVFPLQMLDHGLVNKGQQQDKNQAQEGRARSNLQAWARRQRSLREGKSTEETVVISSSRSSSPVKKRPLGYNPFATSSAVVTASNNSSSLSSSTANAAATETEATDEEQPPIQVINWTIEMILPPPTTRILEQIQAHAAAVSRPTILQPGDNPVPTHHARLHVGKVRLAALERLVKNEMSAFAKRIRSKERAEKKRIGKELAMQQLMNSASAPPPPPPPSYYHAAAIGAPKQFDEAFRLHNQQKQQLQHQQQQVQVKQEGIAGNASLMAGDVLVRMEVGAVLHGLLERIEK